MIKFDFSGSAALQKTHIHKGIDIKFHNRIETLDLIAQRIMSNNEIVLSLSFYQLSLPPSGISRAMLPLHRVFKRSPPLNACEKANETIGKEKQA